MKQKLLSKNNLIFILNCYVLMLLGVIGSFFSIIIANILLSTSFVASCLFILKYKHVSILHHSLLPVLGFSSFQIISLFYAKDIWSSLLPDLLVFVTLSCITVLHYIYQTTK
jgi:hypothetical protein